MSAGDPLLDERDYVRQMEWAYQDFTRLVDAAKAWIEQENHVCRAEPDPQDVAFLILRASARRPPAEPFVRLTTSCVHNMRATLDLLVYALAAAHAKKRGVLLDPEVAADSEFPIVGNVTRRGNPANGADAFAKPTSWGNKAVRGIDPAAQTHIKALQPYHEGANFRSHPLWQLNELDNISKHRLHHPVTAFSGKLTLHYAELNIWRGQPPPPDVLLRDVPSITVGGRLHIYETVVEQDTVIARATTDLARLLDEMQVKYRTALRIVFDKGVPDVELQPVTDVLARSFNYIQCDERTHRTSSP